MELLALRDDDRALLVRDVPHLDVAPTDTLYSLWGHLFRTSRVVVTDENGVVVPLWWPVWVLRLLQGSDTVVLWFTRGVSDEPRDTLLEGNVLVEMHDVHLFETPEYRGVVQWMLNEGEVLVLPGGTFRNDATHVVDEHGRSHSWRAFFDMHPRRRCDALWARIVKHDEHLLLVEDERDSTVTFAIVREPTTHLASPTAKRNGAVADTQHKTRRTRCLSHEDA